MFSAPSRRAWIFSEDYDIDFAEWVAGQVEILREGRLGELDVEAIMEELTGLARSDRRALRSHLRVLLLQPAQVALSTRSAESELEIVHQQRTGRNRRIAHKFSESHA